MDQGQSRPFGSFIFTLSLLAVLIGSLNSLSAYKNADSDLHLSQEITEFSSAFSDTQNCGKPKNRIPDYPLIFTEPEELSPEEPGEKKRTILTPDSYHLLRWYQSFDQLIEFNCNTSDLIQPKGNRSLCIIFCSLKLHCISQH